jgi:hypothetical protein
MDKKDARSQEKLADIIEAPKIERCERFSVSDEDQP